MWIEADRSVRPTRAVVVHTLQHPKTARADFASKVATESIYLAFKNNADSGGNVSFSE